MANKAKHAFGMLENIDNAISAGVIDSYDILFVKDASGKPYVGWIDKDGQKTIVDHSVDLSALEEEVAAKADVSDVENLEKVISDKANTADVEAKFGEAVTNATTNANAYTDEKITALGVQVGRKYEITHKPDRTLVSYTEKEIRVFCQDDTEWVRQAVGENGNANMYYIGFKAYAPYGAHSFREDTKDVIEDRTMHYFTDNDFAGVDSNGRKYSIIWLAVAVYDAKTDTWSYYGDASNVEKYVGWYYSVEWYDADENVIESDCIRINLTNKNCHNSTKPYYLSEVKKDIEALVEKKITETEIGNEIIEF